jgi:hypothetical protein
VGDKAGRIVEKGVARFIELGALGGLKQHGARGVELLLSVNKS